MTVGQKMHQTLAGIQSAAATLKTFALETQDKQAQQDFQNYSQQLESIEQGLKQRINYIEQQEPSYKMQQQAQLAQQQQKQRQQTQQ
ncbi:MAG: DUF1657 domain-containing protein [Thermoanaerobacteraceae bacterium]|nr:DUF1657 domain-containing protein [Thermoanaerobacteraceae bacterium]